MKLVPIALAALLAGGSALAQAPDASQRADNRARAADVGDKVTPGPAQRAANRAKASEVADKATPDAGQRAENRANAAQLADKTRDGAKRAAEATKRGAKRTGEAVRSGAAKVRQTGEAIARRLPAAPADSGLGSDGSRTAMGAGAAATSGDDRGNGARRQRMDDAYGTWQRQQASR